MQVKIEEKKLKEVKMELAKLQGQHKRPKLKIMGIRRRRRVQVKGLENTFNKMIPEDFLNLEIMVILVQEDFRIQNGQD
jgi:hypothetical protein